MEKIPERAPNKNPNIKKILFVENLLSKYAPTYTPPIIGKAMLDPICNNNNTR